MTKSPEQFGEEKSQEAISEESKSSKRDMETPKREVESSKERERAMKRYVLSINYDIAYDTSSQFLQEVEASNLEDAANQLGVKILMGALHEPYNEARDKDSAFVGPKPEYLEKLDKMVEEKLGHGLRKDDYFFLRERIVA